jgi:archaellum component FlaF (FlaF/FlaG flagellin family)
MESLQKIRSLVKQYAKIDLCGEKFKGDVKADINKENIVASLNLKSNTSSVKTKNTYLNSKTKKIKSKIDIVANHNPVTVKLSGKTSSLKVEVDATELMKKEATKAVEKELEKKLGKDAGKLLKGLF